MVGHIGRDLPTISIEKCVDPRRNTGAFVIIEHQPPSGFEFAEGKDCILEHIACLVVAVDVNKVEGLVVQCGENPMRVVPIHLELLRDRGRVLAEVVIIGCDDALVLGVVAIVNPRIHANKNGVGVRRIERLDTQNIVATENPNFKIANGPSGLRHISDPV
jgi:hypothetical protein